VAPIRRFPLLPAPPDWLRDVPFAHRGLHGDGAVENTMAAFEAAAAAGVGVELDVHRSGDGVPVVVHDPTVVVAGGRRRAVGELDAADLRALRLGGTDQGVPSLREALAALVDVPVMVEVKNLTTAAGLLEPAVAATLAEHPGPVCVASFNPRSLGWFRRHLPDVPRAQTAGPLAEVPMPAALRWSLRSLRWLRAVRPAAVSYELAGLHHPVVQAYRAGGGTVVTWTVRTPVDLTRARRLADNVVFEDLPTATVRP
jgi:glycerophosphoryl diester phosphodiesterase